MLLQVKTLKWLKVSEVHKSGGAGFALTYGPPLVLLAVFSLPLLCCTRGTSIRYVKCYCGC